MDIDGECVYYICRSTKSRVRGHLRIYLGYFTLPDGSESPTAESPTPPSLEVGMLWSIVCDTGRHMSVACGCIYYCWM